MNVRHRTTHSVRFRTNDLRTLEATAKSCVTCGSAAAAALYAIAPPAALLALIETGPGEDTDCYGTGPAEGEKPVAKDDKKILEARRDGAKTRGG